MFDYTTNSTKTFGERYLSKTTGDIVENSAGNWNLQQQYQQGSSPAPVGMGGRHPPASAPSSQDQQYRRLHNGGEDVDGDRRGGGGVSPLSMSAMASMGPKVVVVQGSGGGGLESGLVSDSPLHPQIRSGSAATTAPSSPLRNLHQRQPNIVGAHDLRHGSAAAASSTMNTATGSCAANNNTDYYDDDGTAHRLRFTEDGEEETATNTNQTPRRDYEQCSMLSIESPQTPQFASNLPHISTSNVSMFDALLFCPSVPFHAFIDANHTSTTSVANSDDELASTKNNYLDQQLLLGGTSSSASGADPSSMLRRFYETPSIDVFSPLTPLESNAQLMMTHNSNSSGGGGNGGARPPISAAASGAPRSPSYAGKQSSSASRTAFEFVAHASGEDGSSFFASGTTTANGLNNTATAAPNHHGGVPTSTSVSFISEPVEEDQNRNAMRSLSSGHLTGFVPLDNNNNSYNASATITSTLHNQNQNRNNVSRSPTHQHQQNHHSHERSPSPLSTPPSAMSHAPTILDYIQLGSTGQESSRLAVRRRQQQQNELNFFQKNQVTRKRLDSFGDLRLPTSALQTTPTNSAAISEDIHNINNDTAAGTNNVGRSSNIGSRSPPSGDNMMMNTTSSSRTAFVDDYFSGVDAAGRHSVTLSPPLTASNRHHSQQQQYRNTSSSSGGGGGSGGIGVGGRLSLSGPFNSDPSCAPKESVMDGESVSAQFGDTADTVSSRGSSPSFATNCSPAVTPTARDIEGGVGRHMYPPNINHVGHHHNHTSPLLTAVLDQHHHTQQQHGSPSGSPPQAMGSLTPNPAHLHEAHPLSDHHQQSASSSTRSAGRIRGGSSTSKLPIPFTIVGTGVMTPQSNNTVSASKNSTIYRLLSNLDSGVSGVGAGDNDGGSSTPTKSIANIVSASAWENTSEASRTDGAPSSGGYIKEREGSLLSVASEGGGRSSNSNSPAPGTSPMRQASQLPHHNNTTTYQQHQSGGRSLVAPFAPSSATPPSPRISGVAGGGSRAPVTTAGGGGGAAGGRFNSVERRGFGFADYQAHAQKQGVSSALPSIGANLLSSSGVYPSPSQSPVPAPQVEPPTTFSSPFEAAALAAVRIVAGRFMFNPNETLTFEKLEELKRKEAAYVQELEQFTRDAVIASTTEGGAAITDAPISLEEERVLEVGRSHRMAAAHNNTNTSPSAHHLDDEGHPPVSFTVDLVEDLPFSGNANNANNQNNNNLAGGGADLGGSTNSISNANASASGAWGGGDSPAALRLVFTKDTASTPYNQHSNLLHVTTSTGGTASARIAAANKAQTLKLAQSLQGNSTRWWSPPPPPPQPHGRSNNNTGHFYALAGRSATSSRAATPTLGGSGLSSTVNGFALRTDKLRVGMTPLMVAIALGYELVATSLVREYRAFIHEVSPITGESALHVACRCGQSRILRNLLLPATPSWALLERTNPPVRPRRGNVHPATSSKKASKKSLTTKTVRTITLPKMQRPDRYLTPMGLAVKHKNYECVIVMLHHASGNTQLAKQLLQSCMPPTSFDMLNPTKHVSQPTPLFGGKQQHQVTDSPISQLDADLTPTVSISGVVSASKNSTPGYTAMTSAAPTLALPEEQQQQQRLLSLPPGAIIPASPTFSVNGVVQQQPPSSPLFPQHPSPTPVVGSPSAPSTSSTSVLHFLCRNSHDAGCSALLQELTSSNPAVVPAVRSLLTSNDIHGRPPLFYCSTLSAIRMLNTCEKGTTARGGGAASSAFGDFLNLSFAATVASVNTSPCSSFSSYTWGGSPGGGGRGGGGATDERNGPPTSKDMAAVPCDKYGNTPLHVLAGAASVITSGPQRGAIASDQHDGGPTPSSVAADTLRTPPTQQQQPGFSPSEQTLSASSICTTTDEDEDGLAASVGTAGGDAEVWEGDAAPMLIHNMSRQVKEVIIKRVLADATGEDEAVECLTTLYTNQRGIPFLHAIVGDQECVQLVIHELGKLFHPLWKVLVKLCSIKDATPRGNTVLHICANNGWYESLQLLFQGSAVPLNQTSESFLARSRDIVSLFTRTNNDGMAPMFLTAHCPADKAHNTAAVLLQPAMELLKATVTLKSPTLMMSVCDIFSNLLDTRLANLPDTNIVHHFCHTNATEAFRGWRKASRGLLKKESDLLNMCKKRLVEVQEFREREAAAAAEALLAPKQAGVAGSILRTSTSCVMGADGGGQNDETYQPSTALQEKLTSEHTYSSTPGTKNSEIRSSPKNNATAITGSPNATSVLPSGSAIRSPSDIKIRRKSNHHSPNNKTSISPTAAGAQHHGSDAPPGLNDDIGFGDSPSAFPPPALAPSPYDLPVGTPLKFHLRNTLSQMYRARDHDLKTTAVVICLLRGNPLLLGYLVRSIVAAADCQTYLEALRIGNSRGEVSSFLSMSHNLSLEAGGGGGPSSGSWGGDETDTSPPTLPSPITTSPPADMTGLSTSRRPTPRKAPRFTFPTAPPSAEDLAIIHSVTPPDEADAGNEPEVIGLGIVPREGNIANTSDGGGGNHPFISQLPRQTQSAFQPITSSSQQQHHGGGSRIPGGGPPTESEREEIAYATMRDKVLSGTKRFEAHKRRIETRNVEKSWDLLCNFVPPSWESVTGIALEGDEDVAGPGQEHPHSVKYRKKLMIRLLEKFFIFSTRVVIAFQETTKIVALQKEGSTDIISEETAARGVLWEHHPIGFKITRVIPLDALQYPDTKYTTDSQIVLSRRHEYLSDGEFLDVFGCAKDVFSKYAPTRQQLMLKRLKLADPTLE